MAKTRRRYMDVDVIAFLEYQMQCNTIAYKEDFENDKRIINGCSISDRMEDKKLLWMSRPHGTWCNKESEVFIQKTCANIIWLHYADSSESIRAFTVELTSQCSGTVRGNIYEEHYPSLILEIAKLAVPSGEVEKIFEDGYAHRISIEESSFGHYSSLVHQHGPIVKSYTYPKDELALNEILCNRHTARAALNTATPTYPNNLLGSTGFPRHLIIKPSRKIS